MVIQLGAQTHLGQGISSGVFQGIETVGVDTIRDSVPWATIEKTKGVYDFSSSSVSWINTALADGTGVILTFNGTNPLYDSGYSIYTDAGRQAFANFVVAVLKQYPNITAIQIGNEYNSNSFVTGPVKTDAIAQRDDYYTSLLDTVDAAMTKAGLNTEIIGGSTHSIPVDYYAALKADGALAHMDSVDIHPYTTPPEQFEDQIAVLRTVIGNDMPIRVTEFGQEFASLSDGPAYLAKMVAVMGAAGVESASWYGLDKEKWYPNMELYDPTTGKETPAGVTYGVIEGLLASADAVTKINEGDLNYFYTFGDHAAVVWGRSTSITLAAGVTAYDLAGNKIANFNGTLSYDTPIILKSDGKITADSVKFVGTTLVADSYDQFDVTNTAGGTTGFEGPWSYFSMLASTGKMDALYTMGGGTKAGEPWTPYIGSTSLRPLEVNATTVTPADFGKGAKYMVVERYTASTAGLFTLTGTYDVAEKTTDGIILHVRVNGVEILTQTIYDPSNGNTYNLNIQHVALKVGDTVDFIVDSGTTASGDVVDRHIQIFSEQPVATSTTTAAASSSDTAAAAVGHTFIATAATETFVGTAAIDTVDYSASTKSASVSLYKTGVNGIGMGKETLTSIENVIGSHYADKIYGSDVANVLDGGDGNDSLYGREGNDHLIGGAGNDVLDGGTGADLMEGGLGNDVYYVDNIGDIVVEAADGGVDTVRSSVTFTLSDNVERLYLTGTDAIDGHGNALDNYITGNDANNTLSGEDGNDSLFGMGGDDHLIGGNGNDVLDGGTGNDLMEGGAGNDTYIVDSTGDRVIEAANEGTDLVKSSVSFTLGDNVENLTLTGTANIDGTGNSLNNTITGNSGANTLNGGAGRDVLTGGGGADKFVFDVLETSANADVIKDFKSGEDKIVLSTKAFTALAAYGTGMLDTSELTMSNTATTASQHLLYDKKTGVLYYDDDGSGAHQAVAVATLTGHPDVTAHDFILT